MLRKQCRTHFTIAKDIALLRECLDSNPWQQGKEKWSEVISNLKTKNQICISIRTAKERIELLLDKMQKGNLAVKSGTKEEEKERKELLNEINKILTLGETLAVYTTEVSGGEEKKEMLEADTGMSDIPVYDYEIDNPLASFNTHHKRFHNFDEDIIWKRQCKDQEIQEKKIQLEHELKIRQLELEEKRLDKEHELKMESLKIEEKRIDAENSNRELLNTIIKNIGELTKLVQTLNKY